MMALLKNKIFFAVLGVIILILPLSWLGFWHYLNYPKNLHVDEGKSSIIVKWDKVATLGLSHYKVFRQNVGGTEQSLVADDLDTNLFEDKSAEQNKKHIYIVEAFNIVGLSSKPAITPESSWSIPDTPSNIKWEIRQDGFRLTWTKSQAEDVAGYNIFRNQETGQLGDKISPSIIVDNFYLDKDFTIDVDYFYHIKAVDRAGNESEQSEEVTYLLKSPFDIRITEGKAALILEWDSDFLPNFSHYNIYRTANSPGGKTLLKEGITTRRYEDTNVENVIDYYYRVKVFTKDRLRSGFSTETKGKWEQPSAPKNLKADMITDHIKLSWSPNSESDLFGYNVYAGTSYLFKINDQVVQGETYEDFKINRSDEFRYYKIKAVDRAGNESNFSNEVKLKIKPDPPTGFKLQRDYENQNLVMVISWTPVTDPNFSHYELFRSGVSYPYAPYGGPIDCHLLTNEYRDKNFEGNGMFYFVRAVNKLDIKSALTRFVAYRDGDSFQSQVDPLLVKNYGEVQCP